MLKIVVNHWNTRREIGNMTGIEGVNIRRRNRKE